MTRNQNIAYGVAGVVLVLLFVYIVLSRNVSPQITIVNHNNANSQSNTNQVNSNQTDPNLCVLPGGATVYDKTRCEKVKTYRSEKLGIEFQVHESSEIIEEGNRVYVDGREGQYVERLTKYNLQTPLQRVEELNGPTSSKCRITTNPDFLFKDQNLSYPASYTAITVAANLQDMDRIADNIPLLCKSEYAGLNGMTMFLADQEHPTALLFFSIGQSSVAAGPTTDWYQTVRFK